MKFKCWNHRGHEVHKEKRKSLQQKSPGPKARLCGAGAHARVAMATALVRFDGLDHHVLAHLTPVLELDPARDLGK